MAIDDGDPPKTATATLTVIVEDINDNSPRFLKNYRPVLPEHSPPRKVVEVLATDDDDRSKGNGPSFTFRMDPNAQDVIRASFKVEHDPKGANGDGMAVVSSLRSFDREQQKEYEVPIVIKDSGNPSMSGTSTLTIVIGDSNDNKMQPGSKEIFVYNYMGTAPSSPIGRVYVYDRDDWDLPDKTFSWQNVNPDYPAYFRYVLLLPIQKIHEIFILNYTYSTIITISFQLGQRFWTHHHETWCSRGKIYSTFQSVRSKTYPNRCGCQCYSSHQRN